MFFTYKIDKQEIELAKKQLELIKKIQGQWFRDKQIGEKNEQNTNHHLGELN